MLMLSRYVGESIIINENITILVKEIRGDKVRLGIQAPKDVKINRSEIHDLILAERRKNEEKDKTTTIDIGDDSDGMECITH